MQTFFWTVIYYEHTGSIAFVRRVLQASDFLWRMEDIHCSNVSTHLSMSTPFLSLSYSIKLEAVRWSCSSGRCLAPYQCTYQARNEAFNRSKTWIQSIRPQQMLKTPLFPINLMLLLTRRSPESWNSLVWYPKSHAVVEKGCPYASSLAVWFVSSSIMESWLFFVEHRVSGGICSFHSSTSIQRW